VSRIPIDAFEYYVSLGPERSHRAVADHFGVSKRGITKHAVKENWAERLEKIEEAVRERTDSKLADALEEMRERHLRTIRAMHARALTALKQYPLNTAMEAVKTAEMAIKLERVIAGEPSDRTRQTVEQVTRQEIDRLLLKDDDPREAKDAGDDDEW